MHPSKRLFAFGVVTGFSLALLAQEPAPVQPAAEAQAQGETVKVPEHRSRWEYPREITVPPGHTLHVVVKGDTLWDLGQKYLGNPFSWPKIWELNKWITDPHWIYPGDHLIINNDAKVLGKPGTPVDVPQAVQDLRPDRGRTWKRPDEVAFAFRDFIQMPFLVPDQAAYFKAAGSFRVVDRPAEGRALMGEGDKVYLDAGQDKGVKVGDRLLVDKVVRRELFHPDDVHHRKAMGDVIQHAGAVRVVQVGEKGATAQVEQSMDPVEVGDRLTPYAEPAVLPLSLRTVSDTVKPKDTFKVVYAGEGHTFVGMGEMLIIDAASGAGLKVGDVLLIYRPQAFAVTKAKAKDGKGQREDVNRSIGQAVVIHVGEAAATCRVLRCLEEVYPGDRLTR